MEHLNLSMIHSLIYEWLINVIFRFLAQGQAGHCWSVSLNSDLFTVEHELWMLILHLPPLFSPFISHWNVPCPLILRTFNLSTHSSGCRKTVALISDLCYPWAMYSDAKGWWKHTALTLFPSLKNLAQGFLGMSEWGLRPAPGPCHLSVKNQKLSFTSCAP